MSSDKLLDVLSEPVGRFFLRQHLSETAEFAHVEVWVECWRAVDRVLSPLSAAAIVSGSGSWREEHRLGLFRNVANCYFAPNAPCSVRWPSPAGEALAENCCALLGESSASPEDGALGLAFAQAQARLVQEMSVLRIHEHFEAGVPPTVSTMRSHAARTPAAAVRTAATSHTERVRAALD